MTKKQHKQTARKKVSMTYLSDIRPERLATEQQYVRSRSLIRQSVCHYGQSTSVFRLSSVTTWAISSTLGISWRTHFHPLKYWGLQLCMRSPLIEAASMLHPKIRLPTISPPVCSPVWQNIIFISVLKNWLYFSVLYKMCGRQQGSGVLSCLGVRWWDCAWYFQCMRALNYYRE